MKTGKKKHPATPSTSTLAKSKDAIIVCIEIIGIVVNFM